jgi:hypothetical protein
MYKCSQKIFQDFWTEKSFSWISWGLGTGNKGKKIKFSFFKYSHPKSNNFSPLVRVPRNRSKSFTVNSLSKTPGISFHYDADYLSLKKELYILIPYYVLLNYKKMVLVVAKFEKTPLE